MEKRKAGRPAGRQSGRSEGHPVARQAALGAEEKLSSIDDNFPPKATEQLEKAAAAVGVSVESVERVAHIEKVAPELYKEVKAGTKTLHAARQEVATKTGSLAPRKPKVVVELKDGLTLRQVFDMMLANGDKTLEIRVIGQGRASFTTDADIKPKKELIVPAREGFMAYAARRKIDLDCASGQFEVWEAAGWVDGNQTPIVNWKSKLLNFARGGFGVFQRPARKQEVKKQDRRVNDRRASLDAELALKNRKAAEAEKARLADEQRYRN